MKKVSILLAFLFICTTVIAQGTLRTIIFADNNDDRIGEGVQSNLENIQTEIDIIASSIGMENRQAAPLIYEQFNCNPQKLKECIKNFKCGNNDIVLFFYFGHGGRSTQDKSEFPQMCLGKNYLNENSQWVPLEDVKNAIMKQNPRFLLVMGDCCNDADSGVSPKWGILTSASASEINNTQKEGMKRLFLNSRGYVIVSGSSKGEYSWYNNNYPDGGGYLTDAFINELEIYTSNTANTNWDTLMKNVHDKVLKKTQELVNYNSQKFTLQHPRYLAKVTYEGVENKNDSQDQVKVTDDNNNRLVDNNKQINNNDFQSVLIDIASERNTPSYRIGKRATVLSHFANSNVWVDIVGRNNRTVVSSEKASDFVDRISTAFHLRNFTILDCQRDGNGKITALKVHEIYEK